ncbi:hypothetical protein ACOSP7_020592 [Xanthoceras sorbifolium]
MDKSWIHESRVSKAFEDGVTQFLDFGFANTQVNGRIKCPCKNCNNAYRYDRNTIREHMICDGLDMDAEQQLYPGCKKFTKLSFIVRLFHIKCLYGLSDKSVTVLLELFKEALPEDILCQPRLLNCYLIVYVKT